MAGRIRVLNEEDSVYALIQTPGYTKDDGKIFNIYPNPLAAGSDSRLVLRSKYYLCPQEIWIQHLDGRREAVYQGCLSRLDLSGLVSGVYVLRILAAGQWEEHRFVIE